MWATLAKWIAQFLLIPAITKAGAALYNYLIEAISKRKRIKEATTAGDNYGKNPPSTATDDFDRMP